MIGRLMTWLHRPKTPKTAPRTLWTEAEGFCWVRTREEQRGQKQIEQWNLLIEQSPVFCVWFEFEGPHRRLSGQIWGVDEQPVRVNRWEDFAALLNEALEIHAGGGLSIGMGLVLRPLVKEFDAHRLPDPPLPKT